jgi:hypothetical protein
MFGDARLPVVSPETVSAPPLTMRPLPVRSENRSPFTVKVPAAKLPVVVALPEKVEEAVERIPPVNVSSDDVALLRKG